MPSVLYTDRLILRPPTMEDADALRAIADDPLVARWLLTVPYPYTRDDAVTFINKVAGKLVWLICDAAGPVGVIGASGELGYWLSPTHWGKGYATEAARAVLVHYFYALDHDHITSGHGDGNDASANVLNKMGFSYTGATRHRASLYVGDDVLSRAMILQRADFAAHTPLTVQTERLTLRNMAPNDAADLCRIVTYPDVGRMLFLFPPDWTQKAAEQFIAKTQFTGTRPFRFGIYRNDTLIGSLGVTAGDTPDIFYFLDPAAQGHGFGREALMAFCHLLFDQFGVTAITADAFTDNPASDHILRSIGFKITGQGSGTSAARVEPAPITLYRLSQHHIGART